MRSKVFAGILAMTASATAIASGELVATLNIIDEVSNADVGVEFFTFVGSDTTGGIGDVTGSIVIEVDDFGNPSLLVLHDLVVTVTPEGALDLGGTMDAGPFLGIGTYTFDLDGLNYPTGEPPIAAELGGGEEGKGGKGGVFQLSNLPLTLQGEATAAYDLIGLDPVDIPIIFDLATLENAGSMFTDIFVSTDGETVTLAGTITLDRYTVDFVEALVETRVNASFNIFAQGPDPTNGGGEPNICSRADIAEPCGLLDLADILAFVTAFGNQDPIADIDGDGLFALADVLGFVTAFQEGGCNGDEGYYCYGPYGSMAFNEGNAAYAFGEHKAMTAGIAVSGAALMLGFTAVRRRKH